jgi:hypothetical protein
MKKISLNFISLKDSAAKLAKNLSWLFFAIFLLLLVFEVFEIKNSADIILNVNQPPAAVNPEKGVRIDFKAYDQIVSRIQNAQNFAPSAGVTKNPFGVPTPPGS